MKKILLVMCVCAILLTGVACKKKIGGNAADTAEITGTTTATADQSGRETIDLDGDGISDGYIVEPTPVDPDSDTVDGTDNTDDETRTPDPIMEPDIISPGGTEAGLWPEEDIPASVPAYEDYTQMYQVTHNASETSEEWYLSFDSTEADYEAWLEKLKAEGYRESDKIVGFWGNGEQILNLYTEEYDGEFCVSIDIFKSNPIEYPEAVSNVFPEFSATDSTLYGWYITEDEPKILSVSYACGSNFAAELATYKQQLTDAGFTVTDSEATKVVDGKTYTVRYGSELNAYEDCLEYEYHE